MTSPQLVTGIERHSWGNWEEWKKHWIPGPQCPSLSLMSDSTTVLVTCGDPLSLEWDKRPSPFLPSPPASSSLVRSPKSFRFIINPTLFHLIQYTSPEDQPPIYKSVISDPNENYAAPVDHFQTILTFEERVQNGRSYHISCKFLTVLTCGPVT